MSTPTQLTIVGCGVLGCSIADGLTSNKHSSSLNIYLTHRRLEVRGKLQKKYPHALVTGNNTDSRIWASPSEGRSRHVVIIGTQPQYTADVCEEIRQAISSVGTVQKLVVVTVCPGISIAQLENWLPPSTPIVRTMPNTSISARQDATAMFPNRYATGKVTSEIQSLFHRFPPATVIIPHENLIVIVASVSGYVTCSIGIGCPRAHHTGPRVCPRLCVLSDSIARDGCGCLESPY